MAFTAITDRDICVQEGTGAFKFIASGAILAGQAVEVVEGEYVIPTDSKPANAFVGVADQTTSKGDAVAVYGPGNIVWGRASGTSVDAGDLVVATVDGEFQPANAVSGATDMQNAHGIALTTQGTTDGVVKIMLY